MVSALSTPALAAAINKKFGAGTMLTGADPSLTLQRIPSGILSVDHLMGGGFPRGRHTEIFGGYSVGKTYTTYRLIGQAQKLGHECAFVDVEGTFDSDFAGHTGMDLEALGYHRQRSGNRVVNFIETLLRGGEFGVIVLDSIAALIPKEELDSDMEQGTYGTQQAKLMSTALRRLTAANRSTCLVYINQTREAIGVMFGKRSITSGGRAMGFYASTRLEMTRTENIKKPTKYIDPATGEEKTTQSVVGHRVLIRVEKDKTGGSFAGKSSSFVFDYKHSRIDPIEDIIYLGRVMGLVGKQGKKWFVVEMENEAIVGREQFKKWLTGNKFVLRELKGMIKARIYA